MFLKRRSRAISWILLLVFLMSIAMVTGCGEAEQAAQPQETAQPADGSRTIVDQAGREVTIPAEVNTCATCWRVATYMVHAAGGQEKLAGVDDGSTKAPFITAAYSPIKDLPTIGDKKHGINMETLVAVNPDVVFVWAGKGSDTMLEQLDNLGIAGIVLIPENAEDMKAATRLIGEVLGTSEQVEKVLAYYDDTIDMVAERLKDIPEDQRTQVYLAGAHGILSSCGSDFYQHHLIECAGGVNVAAELSGGWQDVSPEQLIAWDPDVIVAEPYCKEGMDDAVQMDPGLNALKAVKNAQLYSIPRVGQWSFPIPQSAMGILWLSKTLYPEQFADLDLAAEVDAYYEEFFGVKYTEIIGGAGLDGKGMAAQQ